MVRVANTLKKPIWQYDIEFLEKYAAILVDDHDLTSVIIFDERGREVVRQESPPSSKEIKGIHWALNREIVLDDEKIGILVINFNNSEIRTLTRQMILSDILVILAVLFTVWSVIWFLIMRYVLSPLKMMRNSFHGISEGDYSQRVILEGDNELAPIVKEFNAMVDQVELRENALRESEVKYRNLVESPSDIIFTTDIENRLVFINHNYEKWTGIERTTFLGHFFSELFTDSTEVIFAEMDSLFDKDNDTLYEQELLTKDGTTIPVELNFSIQHDSNNEAIGVIGIARDIGNRRKAEKELRKYEQMVASVTDYMLLIDRDYTVQAVNSAYLESVAVNRQDLIGSQIQSVFKDGDFQENFQPYFETCLQGTNSKHHALLSLDGTPPKYMAMTFYAIFEEDDAISGVMVHLRDVTEQKKLEAMLQQSQKMEAIGTLAGGIAHDFNNIIGGIIGYAEMIEIFGTDATPKLQERIEHVLKGAYRAKDLVQQILTFSRNSERKNKSLDLDLMAKDVMRFLRASIPSTIEIAIFDHCEGASVWADETSIHQILMNLCANAAHAMQDGGGKLSVALSIENVGSVTAEKIHIKVLGDYVKLSVKDSGTGIDASEIERIFEPFYTTKKIGEGTGMGLAVVHGIVNSLYGAVTVESKPGAGSTFSVYLPQLDLGKDDENQSVILKDEIPSGKGCILFIDDETELVDFSTEILEHLGYEVVSKSNSIDARATFLADPMRFDLVIADQTMPNITGMDLAKKFLEVRKDIPIILCTGYSEPNLEKDAIELGVKRFVKKPFGVMRLAEIVSQEIAS